MKPNPHAIRVEPSLDHMKAKYEEKPKRAKKEPKSEGGDIRNYLDNSNGLNESNGLNVSLRWESRDQLIESFAFRAALRRTAMPTTSTSTT